MKICNIVSLTDLSGFYIVYKGSAFTELSQNRGLNHLVEHLLCKSVQSSLLEYDNYAITYNAITSDNFIVYYITGIDEYINKFKYRFFEEITDRHLFDEESFQQERNVIMAEYLMNFSDKIRAYRYNVFRKYMNYYGTIGSRDCIESCNLQQVQSVYDNQYVAPYMLINISKSSPFVDDNMFLDSFQLERKEKFKICLEGNGQSNIERMPQTAGGAVCMIMGKKMIPNSELYKTQFVNYMLCGNIQKPIYKVLRHEKGLCYYANFSNYCFDDQHAIFFTTETSKANEKIVSNTFATLMDKILSYCNIELFNSTLSYLMAEKRIKDINRYNQVEDLFYNTVFSNNNLYQITYEGVLAHIEKYYHGYADHFIITRI
jgi:predicted Zn-dependent peptidase